MAADIVPIRLGLTKGDLYTLWAPRWRDEGDEWEAFLGKDEDLYAFESVADLVAFVRTNTDNDLSDHPAWAALSTAGMRSTVGFPPFGGHVANADSPVVARLRKAGAILVGKTNAAMLLADFILGKEGQQIMSDAEYFPAHPGVAAAPQLAGIVPHKAGYKENFVTPQQLKEQLESTEQIIQKLFR